MSGSPGTTVAQVTLDANLTGSERSYTLQATTAGGKTSSCVISQPAAKTYILNMRLSSPTLTPGVAFPTSAYEFEVYLQNGTGPVLSDRDSLVNDLQAGSVADVLLAWAPFGGMNYGNYTFSTTKEPIRPGTASAAIATLSLNTVPDPGVTKPGATSDRYYDLWNAAFYYGSPVVEVQIQRHQIILYTLYQYQQDTFGQGIHLRVTNGSGTTLGVVSGAGICDDMTCYLWDSDYIKNAGKVTWNGSLVSGGISRVCCEGVATTSNKADILKWYLGRYGTTPYCLCAKVVSLAVASGYWTPFGEVLSSIPSKSVCFYGSSTPLYQSSVGVCNPAKFYSPTYASPF